jgi:hypothetical protein
MRKAARDWGQKNRSMCPGTRARRASPGPGNKTPSVVASSAWWTASGAEGTGGAGGTEQESAVPALPAPPAFLPLLRCDDVVSAPVLRPAGFGVFAAEWLLLTFAHYGDPVGRHIEADEILLHRVRSARS